MTGKKKIDPPFDVGTDFMLGHLFDSIMAMHWLDGLTASEIHVKQYCRNLSRI